MASLPLGVRPGRVPWRCARSPTTGRRTASPSGWRWAAPEPIKFLVLDPDERPVAGARLAPAWIRGMNLPDELGDRFAVRTDAQGRTTLHVGAADEVEVVRVASGPSGVQQLRMPRPDPAGVRTLRMMPVGRVVGQFRAGDPQAVRGLTVRARTVPDQSVDAAGVVGFASVITDDQGRFTIPAIAAGTLVLSFEHREDLPWRGRPTGRPQVQPGTTTEVTTPLLRAGLVKGVIHEEPSGRPIAGVGVFLYRDLGDRLARSDAEGRFSDYLAPGPVFRSPVGRAPRLLQPLDLGRPADADPEGRPSSRWRRSGCAGVASCKGASSTRKESPCQVRTSPVTWNWPRKGTAGASARSPTARGDSGSPACHPTRRSSSRRPAATRRPRRPSRSPPARGRLT